MITTMFVGTYTHKQRTEGVYIFTFDTESGEISPLSAESAGENPSFLALHPNGKFLYAVQELGDFEGERSGGIGAYALDRDSGRLSRLNQMATHGTSTCHVAVHPNGKVVAVANYGTGSLASYRIADDGSLANEASFIQHEGSSTDPERQQGPHAHSVTFSRSGAFLYVADLGMDKIMIYSVDGETGELTPAATPYVEIEPGSGPRHMTLHPSLPIAYLINEIGNTIAVMDYDDAAASFSVKQYVDTLPGDFTGKNTTADIHTSPDGLFLYGSNRGHDSLAIYRIHPEDGTLTSVGHGPTGGKNPRNFAVAPEGKFVLAANQDSDSVVVFQRNADSGRLESTDTRIEVPKPVCIKFLV